MTLAEILTDESLRRQEFPVTGEQVFLAHAGDCPLPRRVVQAVTDFATLAARGDQEEAFSGTRIQHCRELAARLLNAEMSEISFVGPTSNALSLVASGLSFRRGDNIVIYQDDYPSNVYPWMALAEKGVKVRFLNIRELGRIRKIDVEARLTKAPSCRARFVSLHFRLAHRPARSRTALAQPQHSVLRGCHSNGGRLPDHSRAHRLSGG
jgi:selenocysteine lyase/cysteine desulfurase